MYACGPAGRIALHIQIDVALERDVVLLSKNTVAQRNEERQEERVTHMEKPAEGSRLGSSAYGAPEPMIIGAEGRRRPPCTHQ